MVWSNIPPANNQQTRIMKQTNINVSKLIPAPIDGKNISIEWVEDTLFSYNADIVYQNEYKAMINKSPVYAFITGNSITILTENTTGNRIKHVRDDVVSLLTGDNTQFSGSEMQYIDDEERIIIKFSKLHYGVIVSFYWNVEDD